MKVLPISELSVGTVFDEPIFLDPYHILTRTGDSITKENLEELKKWGISDVFTNGENVLNKTSLKKTSPTFQLSNKNIAISQQEKACLLLEVKKKYESFQANFPDFVTTLKQSSLHLEKHFLHFFKKKVLEVDFIQKEIQLLLEKVWDQPMNIFITQYINFSSNWILTHSIHTMLYSIVLAKALNYSRKQIENLMIAIILMDIGMYAIPISIRQKTKPLDPHEIKLLKSHPIFSFRLLNTSNELRDLITKLAIEHHEYYDGSGYPNGLKGDAIAQNSMIASICDSYTAMIEKRPYRSSIFPSTAIRNILANSGKRFSPKILRLFIKKLSIHPIGSIVRLNNNCIGIVINSNPERPILPTLKILRDPLEKPYNTLQFMDLCYEEKIRVKIPIDPASINMFPLREI